MRLVIDDAGELTVRMRKRRYVLNWMTTAVLVALIGYGLFAMIAYGPAWLGIVALVLIFGPYALLVWALIWFASEQRGPWLTENPYRLATAFAASIAVVLLEALGVHWPGGEPLHGYILGSLGAVFCVLSFLHSRERQRRR
jgi:hypothetical protein